MRWILKSSEVLDRQRVVLSKLRRVGSFLVLEPSMSSLAPQSLIIDGERWHRFMDLIYCPNPPFQLSMKLVEELCEIRLQLAAHVIDREIYDKICDQIAGIARNLRPTPGIALDFGTGDGRFVKRLRMESPSTAIFGCDMSLGSLAASPEVGRIFATGSHGPLPLNNAAVDLITAVFVFHFSIPGSMLEELGRILKPDGVMIGNVYGSSRDASLDRLSAHGWHIVHVEPILGLAKHSSFIARRRS